VDAVHRAQQMEEVTHRRIDIRRDPRGGHVLRVTPQFSEN
jgi:hypothetical protein